METLSNSIGPITKYVTKPQKKKKELTEYDRAMKLFGLFDESEKKEEEDE